jgi:hypothetical protein
MALLFFQKTIFTPLYGLNFTVYVTLKFKGVFIVPQIVIYPHCPVWSKRYFKREY